MLIKIDMLAMSSSIEEALSGTLMLSGQSRAS